MTATKPAVLSRDTAPWAEAMLIEHWRSLSPVARYDALVGDLRTVRFMMRAGARMQHPAASNAEVDRMVAIAWLGTDVERLIEPIAPNIEARPMDDPDPYTVAARVTEALEALGVPHVVVGSLASIAFGEPRLTRDGDLVADLKLGHVSAFVAALAPDFFIDVEALREAVRSQRHFNILHRTTMFKIDVFPCASAFNRSGIQRAIRIERVGHHMPVATPEDCLLAKLQWYRLGNEVSDQQWRDILGIMVIRANALDDAYLDRWAGVLGVADLLARARDVANPTS